jgi:hypothetical protein
MMGIRDKLSAKVPNVNKKYFRMPQAVLIQKCVQLRNALHCALYQKEVQNQKFPRLQTILSRVFLQS